MNSSGHDSTCLCTHGFCLAKRKKFDCAKLVVLCVKFLALLKRILEKKNVDSLCYQHCTMESPFTDVKSRFCAVTTLDINLALFLVII